MELCYYLRSSSIFGVENILSLSTLFCPEDGGRTFLRNVNQFYHVPEHDMLRHCPEQSRILQMNPIYVLTPVFKIHFYIFLSSTPRSPGRFS